MEEVKMLAPTNCTLNSLSLPQLKRKRSDDATDAPTPTKLCTESLSTRPVSATVVIPESLTPSTPTTPSVSSSNPPVAAPRSPAQVAKPAPSTSHLRDTITAQLSLEVLLKHNELRLIDQEIAKCQVALEQLRRCAEIPYPGSRVAGASADVSSGTGASLAPGNGPSPMSPAPWGVTEGPYSRHYARWLLPDPRFDGGEDGLATPPLVEGRSTRGNPGDVGSLAGKTRPQRGSTGTKHTSLSSGYPLVKEKPGPMLIRRKSDGVLVKLVCLDCRRDNFSSTQGFINHCRIAHNRNFASHDAAAVASGEAVEVDDAGAVVGRSEPTASASASVQAPGYVHPLIRSGPIPTPPKSMPTEKEFATPVKPAAPNASAVATPPATVPSNRRQSEPVRLPLNPQFLASPATPHLSALMKSRGAGLDMDKLVSEARTPVDLGSLSDDESDEESRPSNPDDASQLNGRVGRQPMRIPIAQAAQPESRKALDRIHGPLLEESTPSRPQSFLEITGPTESSLASRDDSLDHANLSPHAIESNQAPSLVSDDEDDYEAASDDDGLSSSEADEQEEEFRHIHVEDDERAAAAPAAAEAKPGPSLASPAPQSATTLSQPLKRSRSKKMGMVPFGESDDAHHNHTRVGYVHSTENPNQPKCERNN
jgi:ADA HAT complex component 1